MARNVLVNGRVGVSEIFDVPFFVTYISADQSFAAVVHVTDSRLLMDGRYAILDLAAAMCCSPHTCAG